MRLLKTVNFGIDCTGLTTVGYNLINDDGTENQGRITTGVFETKTNSGIYASYIDFDQEWNGIVLWDTGEEDELIYASEEYNYMLEDTTSTIGLTVDAIEELGGKLDTIYQKLPEDGIADAQDSTTILDIVLNIDERTSIINDTVDDIKSKVDIISDDLKRTLGLVHENIFIDLPSYDNANNLIGARVRIYSDSNSVGSNTNILSTYIIESDTDDVPGKFNNWKQSTL